jgi:hypothetical protein
MPKEIGRGHHADGIHHERGVPGRHQPALLQVAANPGKSHRREHAESQFDDDEKSRRKAKHADTRNQQVGDVIHRRRAAEDEQVRDQRHHERVRHHRTAARGHGALHREHEREKPDVAVVFPEERRPHVRVV